MDEKVDVLVVDDERINLRLLEGVLTGLDLNVVKASSGKEALAYLEDYDFAVVLLDVMMPEMDGFTTAERIRGIEACRHIPIIFVTAISKEQRHVFRGYELGAVDYLFKPVEPGILKSKVRIFVELHRKTRGLERTTRELEKTIDQLQESKRALEHSERRYRIVADYNYDWECWYGDGGELLYISPSCERITGYPPKKFMNDPSFMKQIIHRNDRLQWERHMAGKPFSEEDSFDFRIFNSANRMRWLSLARRDVVDQDGSSLGVRASMRDITSRKEAEERLRHQTLHDPLTGLANRNLFLDRVERVMARTAGHNAFVAIAFLDLDRFKVINDSLGHSFGDKVLLAVSERLQRLMHPHDTVSRFGGDEFGLLFDDLDSEEEAAKRAGEVVEAMRKPLQVEGSEVQTSVSLGLDVFQDGKKSAEERVRNAHTAMYTAKNAGKDDYFVFKDKMRKRAVEKMTVETELRLALERSEFVLYYQPIVDLKNRSVTGFEALIRWNHPRRGLVSPGEFIHVAEETGLIVGIGEWVLHEAASTVQRWREDGVADNDLVISVNISARQFGERNLVDNVSRILKDTKLPPHCLKLEITETVVMVDASDSVRKLNLLKESGVLLSIDDFGTGYSSMSYLQRFPIDQLKVDLSFVQRLDVDPASIEIVRAIINLAHGLRLEVVAEGIETEQQLNLLYSLQCDYGQGYLISRPVPQEDAELFMKINKSLSL
jgi:diguanylate cyclase (GGDEF)-like protein/PAS domain S-box-containing protein